MAKTFLYYNPDQLLLLPPHLREWLPENHLVYSINDIRAKCLFYYKNYQTIIIT